MPLLDVQVSLRPVNNLPEDWITNVWHFDDGPGTSTEWIAIADQLEDFYLVLRDFLPSVIAGTGHWIRMYRVSDPKPRAPIAEFPLTIPAPSGSPLPLEIAAVLSYEAAQISGIPQARRRGRVYLGPFNGGVIGTDGRFTTGFLNTMVAAALALLEDSQASVTWKWSTHSRVLGTGAEVNNGWMDNEPDTQRRRGRDATARVTFS
jgi:hypothetical protein